jgi:hypothetical protein
VTRIEQPAGVPDAAEVLRSIGDVAYEWRLDTDALLWSGNAAAVLGVEPPFIGDVADRPENLRGVRDTSRLLDSGHARPFLGTPRYAGR